MSGGSEPARGGRERLGIVGGTFDPVHIAHLVVAVEARAQLRLDRTLLVVAGDPWQKTGAVAAPAEDRFAMVAAATDGIEGIEASRIELDRGGATYTADTVAELAHPDRDLFLVVGSDVAARLSTWVRIEEVRAAVTLALVQREGDDGPDPELAAAGWRIAPVAMPRLDVSSTDIRARVAGGRPLDVLVPPGALRILRERRLYTERTMTDGPAS